MNAKLKYYRAHIQAIAIFSKICPLNLHAVFAVYKFWRDFGSILRHILLSSFKRKSSAV
ncbi:hypothetical protein CAMGR0001_0974 [Campylobacter gracilis RM3268]|uniref:Uncharacterized protein n=1 Tax=Campylobacter gracilis RM3268 TaxID=553220 RepID=C8PGH9_9BACT|nr:hypothetical protein CAMGR0001_0974 [Campylobacter gracilis RM3268]